MFTLRLLVVRQGINVLVNNAAVRLKTASLAAWREEIAVNVYGAIEVTAAFCPLLLRSAVIQKQAEIEGAVNLHRCQIMNVTSLAGSVALASMSAQLRRCFESACNTESIAALMEDFLSSMSDDAHDQDRNICEWTGTVNDVDMVDIGYCISKASLDALTRIWAAQYGSHLVVDAVDPGVCLTRIGPSSTKGRAAALSASCGGTVVAEAIRQSSRSGVVGGRLWWRGAVRPWSAGAVLRHQQPVRDWKPLWISIVGVGGAGKTTFLRALRTVCASDRLLCAELSEIDYMFCSGSAERFLAQPQSVKEELHGRSLLWLQCEQLRSSRHVVFCTHGSVFVNGTLTSIMQDNDVECVTDMVLLDYDAATVWTRIQADTQRQRRHINTESDVLRWLQLEKQTVLGVAATHPGMRVHIVRTQDDLLQIVLGIINLYGGGEEEKSWSIAALDQPTRWLSPVATRACGPLSRPGRGPHSLRLPASSSPPISICRCGKCSSFPMADPVSCSYPLLATADQFGVSVKVCGCGRSKGRACGRPWCDGSHTLNPLPPPVPDVEDLPRRSCVGCLQNTKPAAVPDTCEQVNVCMDRSGAGWDISATTAPLNVHDARSLLDDGYFICAQAVSKSVLSSAMKSINMALGNMLVGSAQDHGGPATVAAGFVNTTMRPTGNKLLFTVTAPAVIALFSPLIAYCDSLFGGRENYHLPKTAQLALRFPMEGDPPSAAEGGSMMADVANGWHVDDIFDAPLPPFSVLVGVPLNDWTTEWCGNLLLYRGSHRIIGDMVRNGYQEFVDNYKFAKHPKLEKPVQIIATLGDAFFVHSLVAHQVVSLRFSICILSHLVMYTKLMHSPPPTRAYRLQISARTPVMQYIFALRCATKLH
jgi:NAD(P)-dependent dehydrogenase (short-subunit alcohol dehydrogenase family)/adenylate kinase